MTDGVKKTLPIFHRLIPMAAVVARRAMLENHAVIHASRHKMSVIHRPVVHVEYSCAVNATKMYLSRCVWYNRLQWSHDASSSSQCPCASHATWRNQDPLVLPVPAAASA